MQWEKGACSAQWQLHWGFESTVCRVSMQSVNLWVEPGLAVDMQQRQCGAEGCIVENQGSVQCEVH